jgi:NAD(P)-dependent dehydrogenase (short-subunit alcohol dehydrogenase family)
VLAQSDPLRDTSDRREIRGERVAEGECGYDYRSRTSDCAAMARELTAAGHQVVATARDIHTLDDLDVAQTLSLDVTYEESISEALKAAGELDAIVNNAATHGQGTMEDYPIERLRDMFETNAIGRLRVLQHMLPQWRGRQHGVIINVSSVQGRVLSPLEDAYSASKYALEAMSETLHYEMRHFGIRTVLIEPGSIAPGMKPVDPLERNPGYEDLWRQWSSTASTMTGPSGRPAPEIVARALGTALVDPATPLRVPVGQDATMILGARRQMDDATFEAIMRQTLGLTW